jgi:hypothetical protein
VFIVGIAIRSDVENTVELLGQLLRAYSVNARSQNPQLLPRQFQSFDPTLVCSIAQTKTQAPASFTRAGLPFVLSGA